MSRVPRRGVRPGVRDDRGQAAVELLALTPVLVTAAMAAFVVLAAGRAREVSSAAAQAGAMALVQGADARQAAREVVPPLHRAKLRVLVDGRSVTVRVRPRVPLFAARLTASSTAYAGARP